MFISGVASLSSLTMLRITPLGVTSNQSSETGISGFCTVTVLEKVVIINILRSQRGQRSKTCWTIFKDLMKQSEM